MADVGITRGPGHDWEVDYEDEEGAVETMGVFGVLTIEQALAEARHSLSGNFFDDPDHVPPAIVAVRRA